MKKYYIRSNVRSQAHTSSHLRIDSSSVKVWCHLLEGAYSRKPYIRNAVMRPSKNQLKHIPNQDARGAPLQYAGGAGTANYGRDRATDIRKYPFGTCPQCPPEFGKDLTSLRRSTQDRAQQNRLSTILEFKCFKLVFMTIKKGARISLQKLVTIFMPRFARSGAEISTNAGDIDFFQTGLGHERHRRCCLQGAAQVQTRETRQSGRRHKLKLVVSSVLQPLCDGFGNMS